MQKKLKARTQKRNWSKKEVEFIKEYSKQNSEILISNMLINIVAGYMRFRKPKRFFVNLGTALKFSSSRCKSKFQKIEKLIYLESIGIPAEMYELFCWIRGFKAEDVFYDIWQYKMKEERKKTEGDLGRKKGKNRFGDRIGFVLIVRKLCRE